MWVCGVLKTTVTSITSIIHKNDGLGGETVENGAADATTSTSTDSTALVQYYYSTNSSTGAMRQCCVSGASAVADKCWVGVGEWVSG